MNRFGLILSMGTEEQIKCCPKNTTSGITRDPKVVKRSAAVTIATINDTNSTCIKDGKCSKAITLSSNSLPPRRQSLSLLSSDASKVQYVNIEIDENAVIEGAKEILKVVRPNWDLRFVQFKVSILSIQSMPNYSPRKKYFVCGARH